MICFEHENPGDYNANWFAASECSGHCQLLATRVLLCPLLVTVFSSDAMNGAKCIPHTLPRSGGTPLLAVPRIKSSPLPLIFLRLCLSRDAPFPVLLCHSAAFVLPWSWGRLCCLLAFSAVCIFSSCCSCVPFCLSHFFTGWVITTAPEHSCTFSILNLGLNLTTWASFWYFPSLSWFCRL